MAHAVRAILLVRAHEYFGIGSRAKAVAQGLRSEEHTSELQSQSNLVCRLLLEKKKYTKYAVLSMLLVAYFGLMLVPYRRLAICDLLRAQSKNERTYSVPLLRRQ